MKTIMIAEDDPIIQQELKQLLENAGYQVLVIQQFDNMLHELLHQQFDLLLLDINLPKINGEMILHDFRKKSVLPFFMVTSRVNEADEVLSMSYGADDYITKPYNPTILLLRIANIFKRMETRSDCLDYHGMKVYPGKGLLVKDDQVMELTKNEMLVFFCLLKNKGNIVSRDELMTELWNNEEYVNENALTVNISRLRTKLEAVGLKDVIETRKKQGYRLI